MLKQTYDYLQSVYKYLCLPECFVSFIAVLRKYDDDMTAIQERIEKQTGLKILFNDSRNIDDSLYFAEHADLQLKVHLIKEEDNSTNFLIETQVVELNLKARYKTFAELLSDIRKEWISKKIQAVYEKTVAPLHQIFPAFHFSPNYRISETDSGEFYPIKPCVNEFSKYKGYTVRCFIKKASGESVIEGRIHKVHSNYVEFTDDQLVNLLDIFIAIIIRSDD